MLVVKKLNIKCREFQLILQIIAIDYLLLETRVMQYKNLSKHIFFHSNWQRESAMVIHHLLCGPRQPTTQWPKASDILHSNILFV